MAFKYHVTGVAKGFMAGSTMRQLRLLVFALLAFDAQALTPSEVFDQVKSSVVVVKSLNAKGKEIGLGSGVILPSGKVGTNCHVVKHGFSFLVGGDKRFVAATLWGGSEDKDICLLEAAGVVGEPARLGQASRLKVGEPVYAVGAPKGLELSLSDGIVSQLRGSPLPIIQTTAAISRGSSGGGLFDVDGRLVGFTTLYIEGGQSLNFAMPVEWAGEIQPKKKVEQDQSEVDWQKENNALTFAGNWTGSLDWCKRWTKAQPKNGSAWRQRGFANMVLKRYSKAVDAYRQAVRIDPNDGYTWYVLGSSYIMLEHYTEAIDAYQQLLRINPKDASAWNRIGFINERIKRYPDAIASYQKAIRIDPKSADAWSSIGSLYGDLHRYTEAIDALRESVRINPQDATTLLMLGITHLQMGNRAAALEVESQLRLVDADKAEELHKLTASPSLENLDSAEGWVKVGSDKTDAHYANPSTIRRKDNIVKMWEILDFKKAQTASKSIRPYKSMMSQDEYDCEEERMRSLSSTWHSGNMAKGAVVHSDSEPGEWQPIAPGSRGQALWTVACGKT